MVIKMKRKIMLILIALVTLCIAVGAVSAWEVSFGSESSSSSSVSTDGGVANIDYKDGALKINDKEFAVFDENTYVELKEWMLLWIRDPEEEPLFMIESPQYLTWTSDLNWFFFEVSLPKMLKIISLAKNEFWNSMVRFVYLAWSSRFAIFTNDDKTLYFNFPEWWNVDQQRETQIFKYNVLKERYQNFAKIEKLDLGALEENKTIIMNY